MSTRDLDIEVAEKVFGLKRFGDCPWRDSLCCPGKWGETSKKALCLPNYSTNISHAWTIIAAVRKWRFSKRLEFKQALQVIVTKRRTGLSDGLLGAEEIILFVEPEDICNAALEASKGKS